jgi:hypothetical protein
MQNEKFSVRRGVSFRHYVSSGSLSYGVPQVCPTLLKLTDFGPLSGDLSAQNKAWANLAKMVSKSDSHESRNGGCCAQSVNML